MELFGMPKRGSMPIVLHVHPDSGKSGVVASAMVAAQHHIREMFGRYSVFGCFGQREQQSIHCRRLCPKLLAAFVCCVYTGFVQRRIVVQMFVLL